MEETTKERCIDLAWYLIDNQCTIREASEASGIPKTTLHEMVTKRLAGYNKQLYEEVRKLLDKNKAESPSRAGKAFHRKYKK